MQKGGVDGSRCVPLGKACCDKGGGFNEFSGAPDVSLAVKVSVFNDLRVETWTYRV